MQQAIAEISATLKVNLMRRLFIAIISTACLSLLACDRLPESSFELARESRLPKWFTIPSGLSRSDITVTMNYYINSSGRTATFILLNAKKQKLAEVQGTVSGLEPYKLKNPRTGFPPGYPLYEVVTVNGINEIIEHRKMEPMFYITDDPNVWVELGVSQN